MTALLMFLLGIAIGAGIAAVAYASRARRQQERVWTDTPVYERLLEDWTKAGKSTRWLL